MDMDAQNNEFILGMSEYQVNEHVLIIEEPVLSIRQARWKWVSHNGFR